jgi:hypothetical protein
LASSSASKSRAFGVPHQSTTQTVSAATLTQ